MLEFDKHISLDELSDQEIQYHIYRLFTALAQRQQKIKECEQIISMINMAFYKNKR